jgi:hypothetical protein
MSQGWTPPDGGPPVRWQGPPGSLPPDPAGGPLADYLRANAGRYTRASLQSRLEQAGHPPGAIAAAWAVLDAEDAARGLRDRRRQVAWLIGAAYLGTWLVLTVGWLVASPDQVGAVAALSLGLAVFAAVPGIVGYAIAISSHRLRRASVTMSVAFAIVPLLVLVGIAGTCAVAAPPFGLGGA